MIWYEKYFVVVARGVRGTKQLYASNRSVCECIARRQAGCEIPSLTQPLSLCWRHLAAAAIVPEVWIFAIYISANLSGHRKGQRL